MDVQRKLDALAELIEQARAMPMSASAIINRAEVLELVDDIRASLPAQLSDAELLLGRRDQVVADGRLEADRIIDAAYAEQGRLVSESETYRQAQIEAERIIHEAQLTADRTQHEVDDYVDARLANFEVVLQKTLATVARGRAKLGGGTEQDALPESAEAEAEHESGQQA